MGSSNVPEPGVTSPALELCRVIANRQEEGQETELLQLIHRIVSIKFASVNIDMLEFSITQKYYGNN